jgi:hypothetical protein
VGLYRRLYPAVEEELRSQSDVFGQFHGSKVRDVFIEVGGYLVDNQAESLLQELVEEGELEVLQKAPTPSQAAFTGLQYSAKSYRETGWVPGLVEHFWYRFIPVSNRSRPLV